MQNAKRALVHPHEQYRRYQEYNSWLRGNFSEYIIPDKDMEILKNFLGILDNGILIFYGHARRGTNRPDPNLTMLIASQYLIRRNKRIPLPQNTHFHEKFFRVREEEPPRQIGFYWRRLPEEDSACIGKRFHCLSVHQVLPILQERNEWGMGAEIFQYLAILHPEYTTLMDAKEFLNINLPGLEASSRGDGDFSKVPAIDFYQGSLQIVFIDKCECGPSSGSGSLLRSYQIV